MDRMIRSFFHMRAKRCDPKRQMFVETLEDRQLLTAEPLGINTLGQDSWIPAADSGGISLDQRAYDSESLLVRYRDDANCGWAPCSRGSNSPIASIGRIERSFATVGGLYTLRLTAGTTVDDALAALRSDPNVLYAEPNYLLHTTQVPNDPHFAEQWGLHNVGQSGGTGDADIDAPEAWDAATGERILVAVIDTGVDYLHPDLAANMWINPGELPGDGVDNDGNGFVDDVHGYDFVNDNGDPMDDQGHGTHVAGTVGAVSNNGIGVAGVNWNVEIMAVKFLNASGSGTTADAIQAIDYAVAQGATISNNSWGGNEPFSQGLYDAIAAARDVGHIFVAGAGNGNFLGFGQNNDVNPFYPASYDLDNIVSVAATDHNDNRPIFSNYGANSVDLAAPGVNILSTRPSNTYAQLSGTSMATPHVAGVVSLIRQQHPDWPYSQLIHQVLSTVDPVASMQGITVTGGRLNAASALGNPVPPPPPPPSGTLPLDEDFDDGLADYFEVRTGSWSTSAGRYHAAPVGGEAVSTVRLADPLPDRVGLSAVINADPSSGSYYSNALLVFDYQSPTDFKFAGAYAGSSKWVIGRRSGPSWLTNATFTEPIDSARDYALDLNLASDGSITLFVDGLPKLNYAFADPLTDGALGLATSNAFAHFDDVQIREVVPPPPPPSGTLPVDEDFDDGLADYFEVHTGTWSTSAGRYHAAPVGGEGVSTVRLADPLPDRVGLSAVINADPSSGSYYSNAVLVFDYQSPTDFKFAGAYAGSSKWVIGRRSGPSWLTNATFTESIDSARDYALDLSLASDGSITLFVDGLPKLNYAFADPLTDGALGLATSNAFAHFDDVQIREVVPPPPPPSGTLPVDEDFDDGLADYFEVRTGSWSTSAGRYHAAPVGGEAVSTVRLADPLPDRVGLSAVINADPSSGSYYSNALLVFDYQSPTDFKFAGAYAGSSKWVIGRRSGPSWLTNATFTESIDSARDYALNLSLASDGSITLFVDGLPKLNYAFADSLTDGALGLATSNAFAHFDDVQIREVVPPPPPPSGTLPVDEDFDDGLADYFEVRAGIWSTSAGRYHAAPVGGEAVSTVRLADPLPDRVELSAVINADPSSGSYYSNAVLVFDYQSPTDFKFAGAYVGGDKWVVGRRSGPSWLTNATFAAPIDPAKDYALDLSLASDGSITLFVDGLPKLNYAFADSLTDGALGLGTWNAVAHFDNVQIRSSTSGTALAAATSPLVGDDVAPTPLFFGLAQNSVGVLPSRVVIESPVSASPILDSIRDTLKEDEPLMPGDIATRGRRTVSQAALVDHVLTGIQNGDLLRQLWRTESRREK